jgi:DNA modification methylase
MVARKRTSTSRFGAGSRESHDASDFYARFVPPEVSDDATVNPCLVPDEMFLGDSRSMTQLADNCVALVVTSPPYFAGKAYETELGEGHVPASYIEYLQMLEGVFRESVRVLEPGGRIAVNVANLGRKPFRSLAADVTWILQDRLGLLLRGEIIWMKADGASGNCAWGSFQSASNPVLRDTTERVIVASKGRFDRAIPKVKRAKLGLPHVDTVSKEEFMSSTLDVWKIRPESARRVGHPAPFPVELPERLIHLYTYEGDTVVDPFMGSGSTALAAVRTGRRYVGFDMDQAYLDVAEGRVRAERARLLRAAPTQAS